MGNVVVSCEVKTNTKNLDDQASMRNAAQIAFQKNFESAHPLDRPTEGEGAKRRSVGATTSERIINYASSRSSGRASEGA